MTFPNESMKHIWMLPEIKKCFEVSKHFFKMSLRLSIWLFPMRLKKHFGQALFKCTTP
jgi:hypothetical protein